MMRVVPVTTLVLVVATAHAAPTDAPARRLDATNIEGVVDVPRVLFITSREQVRFDDGLGWSYLPTLDDLLAVPELPAPSGPLDLTAPGLPGATSTDPAAAAAPVSATE